MVGSLRDVQLFVAAFETGSFTEAALRENCTQSGVSQHMRRLETALGAKLFIREHGRIIPSPAAHAYYAACVETLKWHAESVRIARTFKSEEVGEIVLGLMPTLTRCALTPALARFAERYPNVSIRIVEGYSGLLTRLAQTGELDFAVIPEVRDADGLRIRPFCSTEEVLVSRAGSTLSEHTNLALADAGPLKVIMPGAINSRNQKLTDYLRQHAARVERKMELDTMLGTLSFIARSDWVAILPALLFDPAIDANILATTSLTPALSLSLVSAELARTPLSPIAEHLRQMLIDQCAILESAGHVRGIAALSLAPSSA